MVLVFSSSISGASKPMIQGVAPIRMCSQALVFNPRLSSGLLKTTNILEILIHFAIFSKLLNNYFIIPRPHLIFFKLEVKYVNMKKSTDSDNGNNLGSMGQSGHSQHS